MLYLLHGGGGDETEWNNQGRTSQIMDNRTLGIEADLIFFTPYGGLNSTSSMGEANDIIYLRYAVARLAAFRTVWWTIADPAQTGRVRAMRETLDKHMLAVHDNGFIPEGRGPEGYLPSREKDAYPLSRLMELGARVAARDRKNLQGFVALLADRNAVVRHWAALGLLMLGADASPAKAQLEAMMKNDLPQNRIVAAEALACLGHSPEAVAVLTTLLDGTDPWPVKLQALNSLTFIGERAKAALPSIRKAAMGQQEYLRNAGRYLVAVLEGRYDPAFPVFVWAPSPICAPPGQRANFRERKSKRKETS